MVTFLGTTGILERFSSLFVFLFVFVVAFGILEKVKIFGEGKQGINALIAVFLAILSMLSDRVVAMISFASPWFVIVFLLIFFIMVGGMFFGGKGVDFTKIVQEPTVHWVLIIMLIVIIVFAFIYSAQPAAEGVKDKTSSILLDPNILGLIAVFLIGIFAINELAGKVRA